MCNARRFSAGLRPASALHWRPWFSCTNNTPFNTTCARYGYISGGQNNGRVRPHPVSDWRTGVGNADLHRVVALVYSVPARLISAAISAWLTASHPSSEVKQVRAGVVLRWGTTREGPVLRFFSPFFILLLNAFPFSVCSLCADPQGFSFIDAQARKEGRTVAPLCGTPLRQVGDGARTPVSLGAAAHEKQSHNL